MANTGARRNASSTSVKSEAQNADRRIEDVLKKVENTIRSEESEKIQKGLLQGLEVFVALKKIDTKIGSCGMFALATGLNWGMLYLFCRYSALFRETVLRYFHF
ncbi:hypothetical protein ENBRE01_3002 [Enteropsectra breve]|nr:hypothetical protein ENBRE01_3002 [Enteropsectra breve]